MKGSLFTAPTSRYDTGHIDVTLNPKKTIDTLYTLGWNQYNFSMTCVTSTRWCRVLFYEDRLVILQTGNGDKPFSYWLIIHLAFLGLVNGTRLATLLLLTGYAGDLEKSYISSCEQCQRFKSATMKPIGPPYPLPIPDHCFEVVAMVKIFQLAKSSRSQVWKLDSSASCGRLTTFEFADNFCPRGQHSGVGHAENAWVRKFYPEE